ncbi:MAG TPA: DUF1134 domain-containing protein [Candidatus Binatia bacterium]|nr:DUF1134 domain-containing protein [Candidatus Binatia bacterium]
MKKTRLAVTMAATVLTLAWGSAPAETRKAATKPAGTVRLEAKQVAAGVGWEWGNGTLTYQGKKHPFKISGLTAVGAGASRIEASGEVYDLKKLSDFDGTYTAIAASGTAGGGAGVSTMRNVNGVRITLHSATQGLSFQVGPEGMKVDLE